MNKKIKITFLVVMLLISFGCQEKGKNDLLKLSQLVDKMQSKDTLFIIFTQTGCLGCQRFHTIMKQYLKQNNEIIYEVNLSDETASKVDNLKVIKTYFDDFMTTPAMYYVVEGERKGAFFYEESTMDVTDLEKWMTQMTEEK